MERGLLWLPLLAMFIGLAWAGWAEYTKIEAYKLWAEDYDQAKYDLYSIIGYHNGTITYGKATRKGMVDLKTVAIADLSQITLRVNDQPVQDLDNLPTKGKAALILHAKQNQDSFKIPFTQIDLAAKWVVYLQKFIGN